MHYRAQGIMSASRRFRLPASARGFASSPDAVAKARAVCLASITRHDRAAVFIHRALPPPAQDVYLGLRALNTALLSIPDRVPTPPLQRLRASFWTTAIADTFAARPPAEPICTLLASTAAAAASPALKFWTTRLVRARSDALTAAPLPTIDALETAAEHTYASIMYAVLGAAGVANTTADHIASHIAKSAGIVAALRGVAVLAAPARAGAAPPNLPLPLDVLARHGVREEAVFRRGPHTDGLREAVFEVATRANDHLLTARGMLENIKKGQDAGHAFEHAYEHGHGHAQAQHGDWAAMKTAFGVFLEAVPAADYLHVLEKNQFDVFSMGKSWRLPFRMWWASSREMI